MGSETLHDLEPELARDLLLRATYTTESLWKEKAEAAMAVVETLGLHTLAIIQAGAFIQKDLCTLEQYPTIFQQQKEQLLKFRSDQAMSTYGNVYATFEVSAEYLQSSNSPEHLDALDFLHTLAFMHNSGISETVFEMASEYASEIKDAGTSNNEEILSLSVGHLARLPEFAQPGRSSVQDRLRRRKARATLKSLSLITVHKDDDSISVHSLVHVWAKERQDDQNRYRAWQSAATILALSCKGRYDYCPSFTFLQPHVRACVSYEIESYTQNMSEMEAAQLLFQFAYVLYRMNDERSLSSLVHRIRLRLQDEANQEIVLQVKIFTGRVYLRQGNFGGAVNVLKEVDKVREKLADDHPDRLASQHRLAVAYEANGQADKAIKLLEYVVNVREKLAEDHPSRLASQHGLALAYLANGQVDKAVKLLEYVVNVQEKLAVDHPDRLASQHELAIAYRANRQAGKAVKLLEYVVNVQEKLAVDHPDRLASQHELAVAYRANGQADKAVKLLEYVVNVREELADDHPDRLASQHTLAVAYRANGQADKAVKLLEYVVNVREELADDHPDRLASQHTLAVAYRANGQVDKAVKLLEYIVNVREKLADDHPDRLASQHELAVAYRANGQADKAVKLLEYVVNVREKLADDHPDRLASQHDARRCLPSKWTS